MSWMVKSGKTFGIPKSGVTMSWVMTSGILISGMALLSMTTSEIKGTQEQFNFKHFISHQSMFRTHHVNISPPLQQGTPSPDTRSKPILNPLLTQLFQKEAILFNNGGLPLPTGKVN